MKIAFVAEAGGGKDFLAEHLIGTYGFTRYAFADEIRKVAANFFPKQWGDKDKKNRSLLQAIGTKFREIDEDVWVNKLIREINKDILMRDQFNYSMGLFVITDCRMPNEYKALKEEGCIFVRIKTDAAIRKHRLIERGDQFSDSDLAHHSEGFLNEFECDYVICNNNSKQDAIAALDFIMAAIKSQLYIQNKE